MAIQADDVLAGIVHNQANVALMRHRHEQALALAERSVALHQSLGSGHGLAVALATLGQIFVQLGDLERAEQILTRTLEVRSPVQFHETTGAVFDTLAQIHLMRGSYERAGEYLRLASEAYGAYGTQTMRWYEWSLKVLGVKLAIRRGAYDEALAMADELALAAGVPPADAIQADLAACEALVAAGRVDEAEQRLADVRGRGSIRAAHPANWGEFLRIRGLVHEQSGRTVGRAPRLRAERQRLRAARRTLSGGAQPAGARPARGRRPASRHAAERYLDRRRRCSRRSARSAISTRSKPPAQLLESRRRPPPVAVRRRRRRGHRPPAGRCGDLPGAARARNRDGAARDDRGRCGGRLRRDAGRRRPRRSPRRLRHRPSRARWRARRRRAAREYGDGCC